MNRPGLGRQSNLIAEQLGYYIYCDLFEWCNQEQLIYLSGISQSFLKAFDWVIKDIYVQYILEYFYEQVKVFCCKKQLIYFVKLFLKQKYWDVSFWRWGLRGACQGGHLDVVTLMIDNDATNWHDGFEYAGWGGHMNIVNLMIEKGGTDWHWGLRWACKGGHYDIVNLMLDKGATYCFSCHKSITEHLRQNV